MTRQYRQLLPCGPDGHQWTRMPVRPDPLTFRAEPEAMPADAAIETVVMCRRCREPQEEP